MKHISKNKITFECRGINRTLTDMTNIHTSATGGVNLIGAMVALTEGKLLELVCHMIRSAGVDVPDAISSLLAYSGCNQTSTRDKIFIKPMPAINDLMTGLLAELTMRAAT